MLSGMYSVRSVGVGHRQVAEASAWGLVPMGSRPGAHSFFGLRHVLGPQ